jgi:hypothetical protein
MTAALFKAACASSCPAKGPLQFERHSMTNSASQFASQLRQFTGSENWYRHSLNPQVLYTDGAKFLAEEGGAYWLLDIIATTQSVPAVRAEEFQAWKLLVNVDRSATLYCEDGNNNVVFSQSIPYTDFPLYNLMLYFANQVIHLPSEY